MNRKKNNFVPFLVTLTILSLLLSGCTPGMTAVSPTGLPPATATTFSPSTAPSETIEPVKTVIPPVPEISLKPGDRYFSIDGRPGFIFSRNLAGYQTSDYELLLGLTKTGGSQLVRIQLDDVGMGYTNTGKLDEAWAVNWDRVFDKAAADGINIIPVFGFWANWNTDNYGFYSWKSNPLNKANGGPAASPAELFQKDSTTHKLWFNWMETLVKRWQGRNNIAAWETFSEINIASGTTEPMAVGFVEEAAAVIHAADSRHRPITASLADVGEWPGFYRSPAIDFINVHPYPISGNLDTYVISTVRKKLNQYNKPVLIGESGLNAATPDSEAGKITISKNAARGIQHAIWAGVVSGAMNGRALWWEDGHAIYFQTLGLSFINKYADSELAASKFMEGIDVSAFKPLVSQYKGKIIGAALGDEQTIIGWYRDAGCQPPDWPLQLVISKQNVTIIVPGSTKNWKVDFYDTQTGTVIPGTALAERQGSMITISLPDFTDDIAFKLYARQ